MDGMNTESRTTHSYDFELAALIGIHEAVLYQDIAFWCNVNVDKPECIHDGVPWMFHSVSSFMKRFPELTKDQIRRALNRLETLGLIVSGCFNKKGYDRTKWYRPVKDLQTAKADLQTANGDSADIKTASFGTDAKSICVPAQMELCSSPNHLALTPNPFGTDARPIQNKNKSIIGILEKKRQQSSSSAQLLKNSVYYSMISERTIGFDEGQLFELVSGGVSEVDIADYVYTNLIQGDVSWLQVYEVFQKRIKYEQQA